MLKHFLHVSIYLLINCVLAFGQEKILKFNTEYPDTKSAMKNSFTLVDENNDDFTIFLSTKSNIAAYHFNSNMQNEGRLVSRQLPNKFITPLGGTIIGNKYSLFFTNGNKSIFAGIIFDFDTKWSNVFEIDLKLKKEVFLTQFNHANKFNLLTASYRENKMFLYTFENSGTFQKKTIDLSKYEFFGVDKYPSRLKTALALDISARPLTEIRWIQKGVPYSLDSMTSLYKLYLIDDTIYLTIDMNHEFTQIISFNIGTEKSNFIKIDHPKFKKEALTNSYILDGKIFQFKINPSEMSLQTSDLKSGKTIKKHHIDKNEQLYLTSGVIHQRGGRYKKYRELEKTSQFLRKVGTGTPGIYVDKINDQYSLTIGSVEEIDNSAIHALAYVNPFTAFAVIGSVTLFINPVAMAFYRASKTRAVYINSFLDDQFETIEGDEKDNIFFIINDYLKQEDIKRYTAADVFKYKEDYIFGMLDKKSMNYIFWKFKDQPISVK